MTLLKQRVQVVEVVQARQCASAWHTSKSNSRTTYCCPRFLPVSFACSTAPLLWVRASHRLAPGSGMPRAETSWPGERQHNSAVNTSAHCSAYAHPFLLNTVFNTSSLKQGCILWQFHMQQTQTVAALPGQKAAGGSYLHPVEVCLSRHDVHKVGVGSKACPGQVGSRLHQLGPGLGAEPLPGCL